MIWRNPVAWLGLATLLIPIAIHLLVRHRAEPRPFPSLRFVQPTRLASVRRKMISDWPLLAIRLGILAAAVAALADPLWQSAARRADWNARQARAIVVDTTPSVTGAAIAAATQYSDADGGADGGAESGTKDGTARGDADARPADSARSSAAAALVQREASGAFRAETFQTKRLADGIRRAADWLRTAPPARRELVVISDFQLGALDAAMLRDLPPHVGIRFVRTGAAPVTRTVHGRGRTQRSATPAAATAAASAAATAVASGAASGGAAAANAAAGFTLRSPRVTLNASETAVTWVDAASPSVVEIDAIDAKVTPREWAVRNRKSDIPDIALRPLDVRLRGSEADRPLLLAAADAVLAQGVPITAPRADGVRRGATIFVAAESTDDGPPGQWDASTLYTQWQVDAARAIATDASLTRAVGRTTITSAPAMTRPEAKYEAGARAKAGSTATGPAAAKTANASGTSSPSPSEATAKSRSASSSSSEAPAHAAKSETSSSQAAAKSRPASSGSGDAPEPWLVIMRDAGGRPAVLAASDGGNMEWRLLVWSRIPAADEATALLIRATLRALAGADAFGEAEVIAIPDATLAQWQRPASEPPASEWRDVDGNDRRWLWGAALVLLMAEQILRRRAHHADAQGDRKVFEHAA